jgi:hypothetical protein
MLPETKSSVLGFGSSDFAKHTRPKVNVYNNASLCPVISICTTVTHPQKCRVAHNIIPLNPSIDADGIDRRWVQLIQHFMLNNLRLNYKFLMRRT